MENWYVSIIVITHNNASIYRCLQSIIPQICEMDELIVVDDHSEKEYSNSLKEYCIKQKIIFTSAEKAGNRAYNRNIGAALAHNPILIFVDADILLNSKSISVIRIAYDTQDNIAYIGTRSAGRYDPPTMSILNGINVQEIVKENKNIDFMSDIPCIQDKRITLSTYEQNLQEQKYYWIYYFSCCCTVLRSVFVQLDGFYENFVGWGVEDIDLGYRISLLGKISFLRDFCGIHIPHDRKVLYAEQYNCNNLKILLKRSQRFDVEFVTIYRISAKLLNKVKMFFSRMQTFKLPLLEQTFTRNCLYINCISLNAPFGKMIYVDNDGKYNEYTLIGMATFFENKSISTVIISSNIILYPLSVLCGILQECLRIGKKVILEGDLPDYRIDWNDFPNLVLLQPQKRNEYRVYDLMEFDFEEVPNTSQILVSSKYLALEVEKNVPQEISCNEIDKTRIYGNTFCVINLTRGSGYKLLLMQLQNVFKLNYVGIYSVNTDMFTDDSIIEFPEHLYGLLSLRTSIILIVEKLSDFNFNNRIWQERNHNNDIVIDCHRNILQY